MAYMRGATLQDCYNLAPKLRKEDKEEIKANANIKAIDALIQGFQLSEVPISVFDDEEEIVCMLGCCPTDIRSAAIIWLLASDGLAKNLSYRFLKHCRGGMEIFQKRYPVLYNFIDARNTLHIKWLKWCGFTIIQKHYNYGYEKRLFYEFIRI